MIRAESDYSLPETPAGPDERVSVILPPELENVVVHVNSLEDNLKKYEQKRKVRLGFQLEILFYAFFFPLYYFWLTSYEEATQSLDLLTTKLFPITPQINILPNQFLTSSFKQDFANEDEFWQWVNNVVFQEIFVQGVCGFAVGNAGNVYSYTAENIGAVPAFAAGVVRIRQVRVNKAACPAAAQFMDLPCYPAYSTTYESTNTFPTTGRTSYQYQTQSATTELSYTGAIAEYPGGGFIIDLNTG